MDYLEISVNWQIDKGNAHLEETMKVQTGSRGIALLLTSVLDRVCGQYQHSQTKMLCIYLWSTQGNQIPELTGICLGIGFYTLSFPSVKNISARLASVKTKFTLLLDSCNTYSHDFQLQSGNISVLYLPSNVMPLMQPMDQGVIENMKCYHQGAFATW